MAVTAVTYTRPRSATLVIYAGRRPVVVRMWRRDFTRLLRRNDVTAVRRHKRGLTLRLSPDAAWAAITAASRDVETTAGALAQILGAGREYERFLEMWGLDGREWDGVNVTVRLRAVRVKYVGAYHLMTDTIEIFARHVASRGHAVEVLIHELGHRAVARCLGGAAARMGERIAPPVREWWWWANKEELVCELGVTIALGRGRVERGAMVALARRIADMPASEAAGLWRHTRWGPGPRAAGVTRRGLVLGARRAQRL